MSISVLPLQLLPRTHVPSKALAPARPHVASTVRFGDTPKPKTLMEKIKAWVVSLTLIGTGVAGTRTYDYITTPDPHRVTSVHDGDTFKMANGDKVRIYGIDAPEEGQPFFEESQTFLAKLIEGRVVNPKYKRNSYDRKVEEVWIYSQDIGREMVCNGYAFAEEKYAHGVYKDAEKEARDKKRGVWTQPNGGERPWDYRARSKKK